MKQLKTANKIFQIFSVLILLLLFNGSSCNNVPAKAILVQGYMDELALRWAPIHRQDVDPTGTWSLNGRSDYITAIDFDGDWSTLNNWENIAPRFGQSAIGCSYYSITLTETHAFIIYAFYHPRDWNQYGLSADAHENDMEGLLSVVELPGRLGANNFEYANKGILKAIVTVFHMDFYSFNNRDIPTAQRFISHEESIDGRIHFESYNGKSHPVTAQQSGGHGLKAYPAVDIEGGDGIVYKPYSGQPSEPANVNDRNAKYKLINIFAKDGLWDRRNNSETFSSFGTFRGDNHQYNAAHAPWNWDDTGGPATSPDNIATGIIATDPVRLVKSYFSNLGNFSENYIYNLYQGQSMIWP